MRRGDVVRSSLAAQDSHGSFEVTNSAPNCIVGRSRRWAMTWCSSSGNRARITRCRMPCSAHRALTSAGLPHSVILTLISRCPLTRRPTRVPEEPLLIASCLITLRPRLSKATTFSGPFRHYSLTLPTDQENSFSILARLLILPTPSPLTHFSPQDVQILTLISRCVCPTLSETPRSVCNPSERTASQNPPCRRHVRLVPPTSYVDMHPITEGTLNIYYLLTAEANISKLQSRRHRRAAPYSCLGVVFAQSIANPKGPRPYDSVAQRSRELTERSNR